jgi:hypothetical protein
MTFLGSSLSDTFTMTINNSGMSFKPTSVNAFSLQSISSNPSTDRVFTLPDRPSCDERVGVVGYKIPIGPGNNRILTQADSGNIYQLNDFPGLNSEILLPAPGTFVGGTQFTFFMNILTTNTTISAGSNIMWGVFINSVTKLFFDAMTNITVVGKPGNAGARLSDSIVLTAAGASGSAWLVTIQARNPAAIVLA